MPDVIAGSHEWAEAGPCMNTATLVDENPALVSAEEQITERSSAGGCVILDVFLAVQPVGNTKFINLILWWRQVGWEILCLGRIYLWGF